MHKVWAIVFAALLALYVLATTVQADGLPNPPPNGPGAIHGYYWE